MTDKHQDQVTRQINESRTKQNQPTHTPSPQGPGVNTAENPASKRKGEKLPQEAVLEKGTKTPEEERMQGPLTGPH